ncbi:MAG TPA: hypothetical protein VI564_07195 [Candidatus Nanoarchaeia archaeon]|nr:hypothetical protein [Candidatus Nanoarchaeia archaeon]
MDEKEKNSNNRKLAKSNYLPFKFDERGKNKEILQQEYDKHLAIYTGLWVSAIIIFLDLVDDLFKFFEYPTQAIIWIKSMVLIIIVWGAYIKYEWIRDRKTFLSSIKWKQDK